MQHPPFPQIPPGGITASQFVLLACTLECDASLSRLQAHRDSMWRKNKYKDTSLTQSLSAAIWALEDKWHEDVKTTRDLGQLPLCWHGTSATAVMRPMRAAA